MHVQGCDPEVHHRKRYGNDACCVCMRLPTVVVTEGRVFIAFIVSLLSLITDEYDCIINHGLVNQLIS